MRISPPIIPAGRGPRRGLPRVAAEYARKYGATILFHYESALRGYAARLSAAARAAIEQDPRVLAVEEDTEVRAMPGKPPRGPAPRPVMPD